MNENFKELDIFLLIAINLFSDFFYIYDVTSLYDDSWVCYACITVSYCIKEISK